MSERLVPVTALDEIRRCQQATEPVLLEFHAPSCAPCRALHPVLNTLAARYAGHLRLLTVDAAHSPDLAERFAVRQFPTLILFRGQDELGRWYGALSQAQLEQCLLPHLRPEAYAMTPATLAELRVAAAQHPQQPAGQVALLERLLSEARREPQLLQELRQRCAKLDADMQRVPAIARILSLLHVADLMTQHTELAPWAALLERGEYGLVAETLLRILHAQPAAQQAGYQAILVQLLNAIPDRAMAHEYRKRLLRR